MGPAFHPASRHGLSVNLLQAPDPYRVAHARDYRVGGGARAAHGGDAGDAVRHGAAPSHPASTRSARCATRSRIRSLAAAGSSARCRGTGNRQRIPAAPVPARSPRSPGTRRLRPSANAGHGTPQSRHGSQTRSAGRYLSALRTPFSWPDHAEPTRGVDCDRPQSPQTFRGAAGPSSGEVLWPSPCRGRRRA